MQKESRFSELIKLQKSSGLTVREFCSNEGIAPSTFYYWHKKLKGDRGRKDFIPLHLKSPKSSLAQGYTGKDSHLDYQSVHLPDDNDNVFLELIYPNGTLLRIKKELDFAHLRALIHLYE